MDSAFAKGRDADVKGYRAENYPRRSYIAVMVSGLLTLAFIFILTDSNVSGSAGDKPFGRTPWSVIDLT